MNFCKIVCKKKLFLLAKVQNSDSSRILKGHLQTLAPPGGQMRGVPPAICLNLKQIMTVLLKTFLLRLWTVYVAIIIQNCQWPKLPVFLSRSIKRFVWTYSVNWTVSSITYSYTVGLIHLINFCTLPCKMNWVNMFLHFVSNREQNSLNITLWFTFIYIIIIC